MTRWEARVGTVVLEKMVKRMEIHKEYGGQPVCGSMHFDGRICCETAEMSEFL